MFKKLKDKLAEEVKSSPQRIQQIAQAAQAAVTSASSSISDITNSDLFSIGDNDPQQQPHSAKSQPPANQQNTFQDVSLVQPTAETMGYSITSQDILDNQRQRRLSNSSLASDVSFRLPSYETPSMYHLQSDMEVSASEAEERGFSSGTISLDRVTKEQLYAAYRRTQDRYTKYRTQYSDLARHYKLLERENAKARSVLVETQDKALRRISELREQCSLEQSAKAHLEKALRVEIEEKNMKIEALGTKVQLLQGQSDVCSNNDNNHNQNKSSEGEGDVQLINFNESNENKVNQTNEDSAEILSLNNKIEKMEQLLTKYKDSLKANKEKNSQINAELQTLMNELEKKNKEVDEMKLTMEELIEAKQKIQELNNVNEELQNKINVYEFNESKEQSTLEIDYQKAQEEIKDLLGKIEVFSKREEEYVISLAENKLSIHKELESKETEIRSLKDSLDVSKKEVQSLNIIINDYKKNLTLLEAERTKLVNDNTELASIKSKITALESQIEELSKKNQSLEQSKSKIDEAYEFLQLQIKQETAEKLAMMDRNAYLENRNTQLSEENTKKSNQISRFESELHKKDNIIKEFEVADFKKDEIFEELNLWKDKCNNLEMEIQEERDELIKLQSEIEKLLTNDELLQTQNIEYRQLISKLEADNIHLQEKISNNNKVIENCLQMANDIKALKALTKSISSEAKSLQAINNQALTSAFKDINNTLNNVTKSDSLNTNIQNDLQMENSLLQQELASCNVRYESMLQELNLVKDENNNLKSSINELELQKNTTESEMKLITGQHEMTINDLNLLKEENKSLMHKINEIENNFQNLQIALAFEKNQYMESVEKLTILENEKQNLLDKVDSMTNEINLTHTELYTLKDRYKSVLNELNDVKCKNEDLLDQAKILNDQLNCVNTLQEDNKNLTLQNMSLNSQAKTIADNYKHLELEVSDIRKSHADMVSEKERLNEIIQKLERSNENDNQEGETHANKKDINNEDCKVDSEGVKQQENIDINNDLSHKYVLKSEYDLLKEENRRFKSDIEGLQTYLTKISKENSILNDKLRDLIANSEQSPDNTEVTTNLSDLKTQVQLSNDKVDDLLRENALLIEENLELKDQIQTQNFPKTETLTLNRTEMVNTISMGEYNNVMEENSKLKKRLVDLEQMKESVDGNVMLIQEKNDKLRINNEKLERRLDEALVSLRHLHSLQENTELEYLRNILYEYFTGSGMHSLTLAKVLSAIVKFDDMQTKLVLQKEKERQGFLRQLGII